MDPESTLAPRDLMPSLWRGLRGRCPGCGKGRLFCAFLKVADECPACNEHLHHHRADDMPPYVVISIVGHIVVPLAFAVDMAFRPDYWIHLTLWVPMIIGLSLALLPSVKGAIVALQWALRMHGFDGNGNEELAWIPIQSTHSAHSPTQLAQSVVALGPRFPATPASPVQGEYPARQLLSCRAGRSLRSPARQDERNI